VRKWKAAGFGLCLEDSAADPWPPDLLALASFVRLDMRRLNGSLEGASSRLKKHPAKQIASGVQTRADFEAGLRAGCDLYQGYFFTEPAKTEAQAPNTSYNSIVTLMKLTQDNAPVGKIEEALKRDAALSFKLLRYINSAGFGLSCEIQSFRHAVAVLGYQNLHKWLALLLVSAARQQGSAALVTTAIARGRLAELVGHSLFDAQDRDNLFIAGAFSLLHVILNMSLEKVAEQVALADTITDALFNHAGPYGPILELVELMERLDQPGNAARATELALSLGLSAAAVNRAQLDALAWAEGMGR
jgi:EAL and modified HD-GYP domain-containing signal transduction protein